MIKKPKFLITEKLQEYFDNSKDESIGENMLE